MEKKKNNKMHNLVKALIVILIYFIYNWFFGTILKGLFNLDYYSNWCLMLISDLLFLIFCVYAYEEDIENDTKDFKNNIKGNILTILKYVGLVYAFTIGIGIIFEIIEKTLGMTFELSNNDSVIKLNIIYLIFRTLIFTAIAETIVYHKTIKNVAGDNKWLYLIITCIFYGIMNIIYQPLTGFDYILVLLICIIRMVPFCLLYNKTNNIANIMCMSFIYNLITLILNLIGGA